MINRLTRISRLWTAIVANFDHSLAWDRRDDGAFYGQARERGKRHNSARRSAHFGRRQESAANHIIGRHASHFASSHVSRSLNEQDLVESRLAFDIRALCGDLDTMRARLTVEHCVTSDLRDEADYDRVANCADLMIPLPRPSQIEREVAEAVRLLDLRA